MNTASMDSCLQIKIRERIKIAPKIIGIVYQFYGQSVFPKSAAKIAKSFPSTSPSPSKSVTQSELSSTMPKPAEKVTRSELSTVPSGLISPSQYVGIQLPSTEFVAIYISLPENAKTFLIFF